MKKFKFSSRYFSALLLTVLFLLSNNPKSFSQTNEYLTTESRKIHDQFWAADSLIFDQMMEGTDFQTPVFIFDSKIEGPAVLIIGGTHGNEPAGFEAAHRLLKLFFSNKILKGKIFIIPESNKNAAYKNKRRIPVPDSVDKEMGNLNRCYPGEKNGLPMQQMAFEITRLIKKENISLVLDLHESPRYHLESVNKKDEYHGLGQTLIYTVNERAVWLGMVAVDFLNENIPQGIKRFTLVEQPIKHSCAWSAGENFNIPAFTVETCRKLPLEERIEYQIKTVIVMLKEEGII